MRARQRYFALDAMRGIAACIVACMHFESQLFLAPGKAWINHGYLAVDFFFVLSGFVIDRNYSPRLAGGLTAPAFMLTRTLRLYPLYLLGQVLGISRHLVGLALHDVRAFQAAKLGVVASFGFALLPAPYPGKLYPLNSPSWSLGLELMVNIAFCVFIYRMRARFITLMVIPLLIVLSYLIWQAGSVAPFGIEWSNVGGGAVRCLTSFLIGIMISRLGPRQPRDTDWVSLLIGLFAFALVNGLMGSDAAYDVIFVGLASPLIVYISVIFDADRRRFRKVCGFFGDISYPVYMTHGIIVLPLVAVCKRVGIGHGVSIAIFLVAIISTGWVAEAAFDRPARRKLSSLVGARLSAAPQVI